jgi:hypothetical protein
MFKLCPDFGQICFVQDTVLDIFMVNGLKISIQFILIGIVIHVEQKKYKIVKWKRKTINSYYGRNMVRPERASHISPGQRPCRYTQLRCGPGTKVCHSEEANPEFYCLAYNNRPTKNLHVFKGTVCFFSDPGRY